MAYNKARNIDQWLICKLLAIIFFFFLLLVARFMLPVSNNTIVNAPLNFNQIPNFNMMERVDPFSAILKEGEELFIKDINGQIKRVKEIKMEESVKIPQAIIDQINMLEKMKFDNNPNPDLKCQPEAQEVNMNLINYLENFHKQVQMKIQEKIGEEEKLQKETIQEKEQMIVSRNWDDADIEKLILDSIYDESQGNNLSIPTCNLTKKESDLKYSWINSNNKTKYMVIYIFIIFPLFMIFYFQNKKYKSLINDWKLSNNYCSTLSISKDNKSSNISNKNCRGSKGNWNYIKYLINKLIGIAIFNQTNNDINNTYLDSYNQLSYIEKCTEGPNFSMIKKFNEFEKAQHDEMLKYDCEVSEKHLSSNDFVTANFHGSKDVQFNDDLDILCKFWANNYNYCCSKYYSMYSTDEASSTEADFNCINISGPSKHTKTKKKVKEEVKKPQVSLLSNITKLFTQ